MLDEIKCVTPNPIAHMPIRIAKRCIGQTKVDAIQSLDRLQPDLGCVLPPIMTVEGKSEVGYKVDWWPGHWRTSPLSKSHLSQFTDTAEAVISVAGDLRQLGLHLPLEVGLPVCPRRHLLLQLLLQLLQLRLQLLVPSLRSARLRPAAAGVGTVRVGVRISDVNWKPKIWYTKNTKSVFGIPPLNLLVFSWYFIGTLNTIYIKFG